MKTKINIFMVAVALALVSCIKNNIVYDTDNLDYRSWSLAAPLAKIHVPILATMDRHIDFDGYIDVKNGRIIYTHSDSFNWMNEVGIENVIEDPLLYPLNQLVNTGDAFRGTISRSKILRIKNSDNPLETYVNEALLSGGSLKILLTVPNNITTCDIELTIPELTQVVDNVPFSRKWTGLLPNTQHEISIPNLNGYKIKTKPTDHSVNVECVFMVKAAAVSGNVGISFTLNNLELNYLSGYFGKVKKELLNSKLEFDFFDKLDFNGTFGIDQGIKIEAKVTNWAGVPARVETKSIKFNNVNNNLLMQPPFIIDVPAASENNINVVPVTETATLKNVDFVKDDYPDYVNFEIVGVTNPERPTNNFIARNKNDRTDVDLIFTVPLVVKLKDYNRNDEVEFDYKDMLDNKEELHKSVKEMTLNFVVDNITPFKVILSVHAVDDDGKRVGDYIVENEVINVNDKNKTIKVDKITREQLDKFWDNDVKYIVVNTQAATLEEKYWPITKDNYLDITVSMNLKANVPLFTLFE